MKKLLLISIILTFVVVIFGSSQKPLTWELRLNNEALPEVTNSSTTTSPLYGISIVNLADPTEVRTTANTPVSALSINRTGNGTTVPYWVRLFFNCSAFVRQWNAGETVQVTVTYLPTMEATTWSYELLAGSNAVTWRYPNHKVVPPTIALGFNLNVTSTPAGATIWKDGVNTNEVTPHTFFPGEAGTYTLGAMAGYTAWTPVEHVVPALTAEQTIDFQATLIPDVYTYTLNVAGPAGHGVTGPTGLMPFPAVFVAPDTDMENELVGLYTPTAAPAGFYWNPTTIDVTAGMFSAAKGVAMGSRSNGTKATYNYVANIAFELLPIPTTTFTLNVTGPDGYAVSGPVAGVTDYVATDSDDMINELTGDYTIAAPPAGYTWAAQTITVSEVNFVANVATIEFVLNEIPPVVTPADPAGFPAGYPSTNYVNNAFVVTGVGVHNLFIPRMPTDTGAMAYYNGMWNLPDGTPDWTWLNVNLSAKAPVQVIVFGPTLPVELSSFSAILTAQNFVKLTWVTESETNMNGYNVYRNETADYAAATHIGYQASTNSSTQHVYTHTDNEVETNNTYYYWLECVDFNGTSTLYGPQYVTVVGNDTPNLPTVTTLNNAYPNPFKSSTTIAVDVKEGENATVTIYNILGQAVMTYRVPAGTHNLNWNGRDSKGNACGSGIYFYKLTSPTKNQTKKMVIVK